MDLSRSLRLSARETQIVKGIFDDLKDMGIAERLEISPHTVHTYIQRIYSKLGVASRTELILRVVAVFLHAESAVGGNGSLGQVPSGPPRPSPDVAAIPLVD